MGKYLVILESPGKIKTVSKYLGSDYKVVASMGHCIDLPIKKLGVNIKKDFEPEFVVITDKGKILTDIKKQAQKSSVIYIFTDLDREGCAISYHLANYLNMPDKIKRIKSGSMTKQDILNAIHSPTNIEDDKHIIDAYLCRRILDRLVGYRTSFLTQQCTGGRSAGRVQSAILRIIVDREKEIQHFIPEEYWVLTALFKTSKNEEYSGVLDDKIKIPNEQEATKIYEAVKKGQPTVTEVESKIVEAKPYAPFTTMSMIQASSTYLGWPAQKTMKVAQFLYENSKCTYHRSDSPAMSDEAMNVLRPYIVSNYGDKYLSDHIIKYAAKEGAQEGHECIRPTDFNDMCQELSDDDKKLYKLIWKRAVASQMKPGVDNKIKIVTSSGGYDFVSRGSIRIFDGFRKVWDYSAKEDILLPEVKKGEKVALINLDKEQKFTLPPSRYSDASLSKTCEQEQITRPSTFATSIKTLLDRGYIIQSKKSFQATDLGIKVVGFLVAADMCFVSTKFTAEMEDKLDKVASNQLQKLNLLTEFWERLKADIANGNQIKQQQEVTDFDCPECHSKLKLKHSKYGAFFSCSSYKKEGGCKYTAKVGTDGMPVAKQKVIVEYADFKCKCGGKFIKRNGKHGEFFGCEHYSKGCKITASLDGTITEPKKKKYWKKKHDS